MHTKTIVVAGMKMTPMGIVFPAKATMNDWVACGEALSAVSEARCWAIGDWWAFCIKKKWDRSVSKNGHIFDMPRQRVYDYSQISKAFPKVSSREETLKFKHYRYVVAWCDTAKDRAAWLKKAVDNNWSAAKLKRELGGEEAEHEAPVKGPDFARLKRDLNAVVDSCTKEAELRRMRLTILNILNAINKSLELEPVNVES